MSTQMNPTRASFAVALLSLTGACGHGTSPLGPVAHAAAASPASPQQEQAQPQQEQAQPATAPLDRSKHSNVGTDAPLDYGLREMWACRPDLSPNECDADLAATELHADGSRVVVPHGRADDPAIDCFYVYPTVLLTGAPQMVDFSDAGVAMVNDALLAQGARFSSHCRVFAPLYRQSGLSNGKPVAGTDRALGAQDVRDAFAHYLEHWNGGRGFVLVGHSQGTGMLTSLIAHDIDPQERADVRARMLAALLLGGSISVPRGEAVGGTFQNVPLCEQPGQRGCVVAYASYAAGSPPSAEARFGKAADGMQAACVDPAQIAGHGGALRASYFRKGIGNASFTPDSPLPDDLTTPFAVYREAFTGRCVDNGSHHYLEVARVPASAAGAGEPPWRNARVEGMGMGLHLVDFQLALGDLLTIVENLAKETP